MDTAEAKAVLQTKRGQIQNELNFLDLMENILTTGWETDTAHIESEVASQLSVQVDAATATLQALVADKDAQLDAANVRIAELEAVVAADPNATTDTTLTP